jgi:hypothetical protein
MFTSKIICANCKELLEYRGTYKQNNVLEDGSLILEVEPCNGQKCFDNIGEECIRNYYE